MNLLSVSLTRVTRKGFSTGWPLFSLEFSVLVTLILTLIRLKICLLKLVLYLSCALISLAVQHSLYRAQIKCKFTNRTTILIDTWLKFVKGSQLFEGLVCQMANIPKGQTFRPFGGFKCRNHCYHYWPLFKMVSVLNALIWPLFGPKISVLARYDPCSGNPCKWYCGMLFV